MKRDLEQLAKDCGTKWTYSEVVAEVYYAVKDMPLAVGVTYLQGILSRSALTSIRHAADCVIQEMGPEMESFRMGYATPVAPVNFDQFEQIPMEFVRYVSSKLTYSPDA